MKKIKVLFLIVVTVAGAVTVSAQRGYRGGYGRGYSHNYGRVYNGSYGYPYRGSYNAYNSSPFIRSYRPAVFGPQYYGVPHGGISITFGGNPYYSGGAFYRPYGGYYRSIFPPIGIRIGILPVGYLPIYVGPDLFYFYNGIYYRRYDEGNYEVVDAPMGAELSSLPSGARSVTVNSEKFYELNGTYYKEDRNAKGQRIYTVVGKNGQIDNTENEPVPAPVPAPAPQAAPKTGDRVAVLPDNCKTVVVNGQKFYVSPDNTYYQPEADGSYTIAGTANDAVL